ncbi:hypothetical protein RFI_08777 [Reticulomyxa filosa]|uniref:Uncharacterized protein n=1 Tax=Reticulomyxa filosa TaxID=46433 RepID=X6NR18_RETFI|nr:hypothetical protein RFI_08777 [Reticulomyxa filosa]|eukprot:ETO28358.1 hypothetical protein RFI_08777 [Reticulomyxa filosa]
MAKCKSIPSIIKTICLKMVISFILTTKTKATKTPRKTVPAKAASTTITTTKAASTTVTTTKATATTAKATATATKAATTITTKAATTITTKATTITTKATTVTTKAATITTTKAIITTTKATITTKAATTTKQQSQLQSSQQQSQSNNTLKNEKSKKPEKSEKAETIDKSEKGLKDTPTNTANTVKTVNAVNKVNTEESSDTPDQRIQSLLRVRAYRMGLNDPFDMNSHKQGQTTTDPPRIGLAVHPKAKGTQYEKAPPMYLGGVGNTELKRQKKFGRLVGMSFGIFALAIYIYNIKMRVSMDINDVVIKELEAEAMELYQSGKSSKKFGGLTKKSFLFVVKLGPAIRKGRYKLHKEVTFDHKKKKKNHKTIQTFQQFKF